MNRTNPYAPPRAEEPEYVGPMQPGKAAGFAFFICLALGLAVTILASRSMYATGTTSDVYRSIQTNFARFEFQFRGVSISLLVSSLLGICVWLRAWKKCQRYEADQCFETTLAE